MPPKKKKKHKKKRVVGVPRVNVVQNNVMSTNGKPLEVVVKNNRTTWGELSVKEREDVEKKRGITRYNPGGSGVGIGVNMSGSSRLKDLENAMDDYGPTQYRAEIKGLREEMDDQMGRHEEQVATMMESVVDVIDARDRDDRDNIEKDAAAHNAPPASPSGPARTKSHIAPILADIDEEQERRAGGMTPFRERLAEIKQRKASRTPGSMDISGYQDQGQADRRAGFIAAAGGHSPSVPLLTRNLSFSQASPPAVSLFNDLESADRKRFLEADEP